jgi:hypothetical protein
LVGRAGKAGGGKTEREREQHLYGFRRHFGLNAIQRPFVAKAPSARQPILNEWLTPKA